MRLSVQPPAEPNEGEEAPTGDAADALWKDARASLGRLESDARRTPRRWLAISAALGLSVVLVVASAFLLAAGVQKTRDSLAWVGHSNKVLLKIGDVEQGLYQLISDTRAYAISGDPAWVGLSRQVENTVHGRMGELRGLVSDNASQTARLDVIVRKIAPLESELEHVLVLVPARLRDNPALATLGDFHNRERISAPLLAAVARLQAAELRLLDERQNSTNRDMTILLFLGVATGILALTSAMFAIFVILRERDRTQARELRLELMHTQRLAMMGETSAMLAHEVKQPLTAVKAYLSAIMRLGLRGTETSTEIPEIAQRASEQIDRATQIVQRLRSFIDKRPAERADESPAQLIADSIALFGRIGDDVSVDVDVEPNIPFVRVDRVQLQQVLFNLIRNALEAMQPSTRKELHLSARAGGTNFVEISLRDTGPGLPARIREHLFEPFTSGKSDGLGVGLSICRTIVEGHGGSIRAESDPNKGTVFTFSLPVASVANVAGAPLP